MAEWQPMSRDRANDIVDQFKARLRGGQPVTTSYQDWVRLREALMVRDGLGADVIRRELEEEWGTPLD